MPAALVIGSSSGIGLETCRRLVAAGWTVAGIARRDAPLADARFTHHVGDVRAPDYHDLVARACDALGALDAVIYCSGVGRELALDGDDAMAGEADVIDVNLRGCVITAEVVIPKMIAAGRGRFVGLSSQADRVIDGFAPSYNASKAGMSSYLEGLALACRPRGVHVCNVRFGFVDTEMAKSDVRPFMITAERAAAIVVKAIGTRSIRVTHPWRMAALLWFFRLPRRIRIWLS